MTTFTVHEPPPRKNEATASPVRFAFVRDGFYFWAFLLGPVWMLYHRLWLVDPDSRRYLSEDFAFCRLWRDIGGKVFVDLECKLNHLGQHMYRGDLAESLRVQGRW